MLGDLHLCDTPPVAVLDKNKSHREGWQTLQRTLVRAIIEIESNIRVLPGDMFHRPSPGPLSVRNLHQIMSSQTHNSGTLNTIWTLGQHDVPQHDVRSWPDNMIGVAVGWATASISGLMIGPQVTSDSFARCIAWGDEWDLERNPKCDIIVAHKSVGEDRTQASASALSLQYGEASICAFGDIHSGIAPVMVGDTLVLNPGPLLPTSRSDLSRFGYAYIVRHDFNRKTGQEVEEVDLLGHLRTATMEWLEDAMHTREDMSREDAKDFDEIMGEVRALRLMEVSDEYRVDQIAKTLNTPDRVVEYIRKKLQEIQ